MAASSQRQHLVPVEVQSNAIRYRSVEIVGVHCFLSIPPERLPGFALGEDFGRQALGAVAAVGLLRRFEDQFGYVVIVAPLA